MPFFGVLCSPFEMEEWVEANGFTPDFPMIFEHWDQQRPIDRHLAKAKDLGFKRLMLTWEPWTPPPAGLGNAAQGALQPEWSNETIANGDHTDYIRMISKNIRESGLDEVWIRWGHEMNGDWHPWRTTPDTYVAAWKKIVNTFRGGSTNNARFMWAPNSSLYQDPIKFLQALLPYWPGRSYVDLLGLTAINFGGDKERPVSEFLDRFELCRRVFNKPLVAAETNCAWSSKTTFFYGLRRAVEANNILHAIVLSQPSLSRGQANNITSENMQWNISTDRATLDNVRDLVDALHEAEDPLAF